MKKINGAKDWVSKRTCHNCGGIMHRHRSKLSGIFVRGWECGRCGEGIILTQDAQKALVLNQLKKGIPAKIHKLGNYYTIRIPKRIYEAVDMKNKDIDIYFQIKKDGRKVITLEF